MIKYTIIILLISLELSCSKDFLKTPPSSDETTVQNLTQLKGLLNNYLLFGETPVLGEQSSGDYYLNPDYYAKLSQVDKNIYTWQKDIFNGQINIPDWNEPYSQINTCNVVLEGLLKITPNIANKQEWKEIKGCALFMLSFAIYNISQIFAEAYDQNGSNQNRGVSIPLTSDIDVISPRSTVKDTYGKIINDLLVSLPLLPPNISTSSRNLPNRPAAFALLARIYLSMSDYVNARIYADSCLSYQDTLINYNSFQLTKRFPFTELNVETLYQSWLRTPSNIIQGKLSNTIIDSTLYNSYDTNDLRKYLFFTTNTKKQPIFNYSYTGSVLAFSGLATDETYMIRAECNARQGQVEKAMADVNKLMSNRYRTNTFSNYQTLSKDTALKIILQERRKELIFRGLRWSDLRRLNKEEANKATLNRVVGDSSYQLLPTSNHYVLPIPDDALRGGYIMQNNRD